MALCDTVSVDTYWHGSLMSEAIEAWTAVISDGAARYCTAQMEDRLRR